jgi:hypothetical protein
LSNRSKLERTTSANKFNWEGVALNIFPPSPMSAGLQLGLQVIAEPLRDDRDAFKIDTRRFERGL